MIWIFLFAINMIYLGSCLPAQSRNSALRGKETTRMAKKITGARVIYLKHSKKFLVVFKDSAKKRLVGISDFLGECNTRTREKTLVNAAIIDIHKAGYETAKNIHIEIEDFCVE
jgi:hypothetical protein